MGGGFSSLEGRAVGRRRVRRMRVATQRALERTRDTPSVLANGSGILSSFHNEDALHDNWRLFSRLSLPRWGGGRKPFCHRQILEEKNLNSCHSFEIYYSL